MTRECHVRFCERLGVRLPGATLPPMTKEEGSIQLADATWTPPWCLQSLIPLISLSQAGLAGKLPITPFAQQHAHPTDTSFGGSHDRVLTFHGISTSCRTVTCLIKVNDFSSRGLIPDCQSISFKGFRMVFPMPLRNHDRETWG